MKLFNIIIGTLYLTFTIGVGISRHYCMGILQNVEIGFEVESCCPESDIFGDCCSDSHELLVIEDDQNVTDDISLDKNLYFIHEIGYSSLENNSLTVFKSGINQFSNPPPLLSQDRRVRMCSLVLYA